jgi:dTDP-4-amino-4,6-dideoxygalactose transaminase
MALRIPVLNLQEQYQKLAPELESAVLDVLRSGNYILGRNGERLEAEIANVSGAKHGIGVANGTDALHLALWCLDIGEGDEVITTPFTFAATASTITLRGAKPVFVDINPSTFNIDPNLIERAITSRTKAILPVHLFGLPSEMDAILNIARKHSLRVIEDNAQGIGALYKGKPTGGMGDLSCISFYPTKNLGACGDAGMVVTNDDILAERLRTLRAHGMRKRYYHDEVGLNSRLDEVQAAILLAKLPYLKLWNAGRQIIAEIYDKALQDLNGVIRPIMPPPPDSEDSATVHVWHQYTVRVQDNTMNGESVSHHLRDTVMQRLAERGIGSMCYYPVPLHLQTAFTSLGYRQGDFPITEAVARQVISLPMYPELSETDVHDVVNNLSDIVTQLHAPVVQPVTVPSFLAT